MSTVLGVEITIPQRLKSDDLSIYLPRNLSFCEDGVLDQFSVSYDFVRTSPSIRLLAVNVGVNKNNSASIVRSLNLSKVIDNPLARAGLTTMTDMQSASVDAVADTLDGLVISKPGQCARLNSSSDTMESEEGVFMNMMDDLDSLGSGTASGLSLCSDDFAVDSINSPDEDDQEMKAIVEAGFEDTLPGDIMVSDPATLGSAELPSDPPSEPLTDPQTNTGPPETDNITEAVACAASPPASPSDKPSIQSLKKHDLPGLKIALNDVVLPETPSEKSIYDLFITTDSPIYEDREFHFTKTELRKSTSLKTNKTPPGTPQRKKVVRFADAMGLDLESVRHILNIDSPPKIPSSAMKDLQIGLGEDRRTQGTTYLSVTFPQPGAAYNFIQKVLEQKVCLENAVVTDLTITGFVRVANIGFHKAVRVRYTVNNWESFYDIAASYVQNSCDGPTDRFSFSVVAPPNFMTGSKLQFAISYTCNDCCYWDSNGGNNYVFECFAKTVPSENDNSWMHFL